MTGGHRFIVRILLCSRLTVSICAREPSTIHYSDYILTLLFLSKMDRLSQDQIPTVDISSFTSSSSSAEKQSTAKEFAEKCSQSGCLRITGHGIPLDMIQRAFATCKQLYDLPYEDKMKAPHPPTPLPHRGYSGVGGEKTAPKYMYDTDAEDKKIVTKDEYVKGIDYKVRGAIILHATQAGLERY